MSVEVMFGNRSFTIPGRDLRQVQAEVDAVLLSDAPGWIEAYEGHGGRTPSRLLVTPGIPIALTQLPES